MNTKDQKFIEEWPEKEKKGKIRYAIVFGTLWGLFTAILGQFIRSDSFTSVEQFLSKEFSTRFAIFILIGYLIGSLNWRKSRNRFEQLTQTKP